MRPSGVTRRSAGRFVPLPCENLFDRPFTEQRILLRTLVRGRRPTAKTAKSVAQVTVRDKTCELTWLTCNCAIGSLDAAGAAVAAEISHDQDHSCSGERQRYRRGRFRNGAGCGAAVSGASRLL